MFVSLRCKIMILSQGEELRHKVSIRLQMARPSFSAPSVPMTAALGVRPAKLWVIFMRSGCTKLEIGV